VVHERLYHGTHNYYHPRSIRIFACRDTPLRSLYRLFEFVCAQDDGDVMLEGQYFWYHPTWRLCDIPDPCDPDLTRYAVLASLVETMVMAFNHKIDLGLRRRSEPGLSRAARKQAHQTEPRHYESGPSWTSRVPRLREQLVLMPRRCEDSVYCDSSFLKRNILAAVSQLRNV
jgi:hypothetical protein